MKTLNANKVMVVSLSVLISLALTSLTHAYPPDNAALLYYRICLRYQPDRPMKDAISKFAKGNIELTDQIKQFVEKNQYTINLTLTASDIPTCDWGLDHSEGLSSPMPPLGCLRGLSHLIIADARIYAQQGDYITALKEALSVKRMLPHANDNTLVSNLVGFSFDNIAERCIQDILFNMSEDLEMLLWLRNELIELSSEPISLIKSSINEEAKIVAQDFRTEKTDEILKILNEGGISCERDAELLKNRVGNCDESFYKKNTTYYMEQMASIIAMLDLNIGYGQTISKLKEIAEKIPKEAQENPDATLAGVFMPALTKVYNYSIVAKTSSNAIKAAVEIYIIQAKTGKLPDRLPESLPKDMFSGKDFEYIKNADGFLLRCREEDLVKNKVHEYEFKVKK